MSISRRGTAALSRWIGTPANWCGSTQSGWLSSSTPAVAGDTVMFATRPGRVVALHRQTGARRWETDLQSPIVASPIVAHGTVYIGAADKNLYALDASTGRQRWAFTTQAWIVSAVAYAEGRVIVTSQDSRLYVVGAETGRQRLLYETGMGRHIGAGPAIQGDRAYFGLCRCQCVGDRLACDNLPTGARPVVLADQPVPLGYALETADPERQRVVETRRRRRQAHTRHCP